MCGRLPVGKKNHHVALPQIKAVPLWTAILREPNVASAIEQMNLESLVDQASLADELVPASPV
jgi:hypothetical protein